MFQPVSPVAPHGEDSVRTMPTARFSHPTPLPQAQPPRPAPQPAPASQPLPPERSAAIDLVQRRVPYGESTPRPDAPQNDLFGGAPPPAPGAMGSMQGGPAPWHSGNVPGMPPPASQPPAAPQPPAPAGVPAYVYVLASLALLAVAVAVLLYVLRMRG